MNFRVCIAGRNHAEFTEECLRSIVNQDKYSSRHCAIDWTDDASENDDVAEIATEILYGHRHAIFAGGPDLITCNSERLGGLANLWRAIHRAHDDDVCVIVGGDDYLRPGALARIAREYEDPECWATYGEFENTNGAITNTWREWDGADCRPPLGPKGTTFMWAPITVRAWLAKKIVEDDLKMAGSFFMSAGDGALNTPIFEMAGPEHARWINECWYVRRIHPKNDGWVDPGYQAFCSLRAYQKPKYGRLRSRGDTPIRTSDHYVPYGLVIMPDEPHPRLLDLTEVKAYRDALKNPPNVLLCEWRPEDIDGVLYGSSCGKKATCHSCKPYVNTPTCDAHKCRCAKPLASSRA